MSHDELFELATAADYGISVEVEEPEKFRQALYRTLRKRDLGDTFSILTTRKEVFIVRKGNVEGA